MRLKALYMKHAAARTVMKCKKTDHITPILRQLHWLPIQERICHKILSATYRSVHDNTPLYLSDLLQKHNPSRLLRSASRFLLDVPGPRDSKTKGTASEPSDMSLPPSGMSSPRASRRRTPFSLSDLRWKPISLPRDDSQCDCVRAPVLVCVLSEVDVAIITLCVCVCVCVCVWFFFLLSLFVTLYIFLHLTVMYSSTFGKGWVGRSCLYFLVWVHVLW